MAAAGSRLSWILALFNLDLVVAARSATTAEPHILEVPSIRLDTKNNDLPNSQIILVVRRDQYLTVVATPAKL